MPRKKKNWRRPPPPGPPENYTWIDTREGGHWRANRGTYKEAKLNEAFQKNADNSKWASPAAKRIKERLYQFLKGLDTGRLISGVASGLKKQFNKTGDINYTLLKGYEWQPYHYLREIYRGQYSGYKKGGEFIISVQTGKTHIKRLNKLVDGYFFDAILLYGDPTKKNNLRIESETSPVYSFFPGDEMTWKTSFTLPDKKPWMVILKLSSLEKGAPASHGRHYGMQTIGVGTGIQ